jgi:hypothetical protein
VALERKWRLNVEAFGGRAKLITLTPPGQDVLPWGDDVRSDGTSLVEWADREPWNATAQLRASRLFEAAQKAADRWVRKQWSGPLPRQLGNVKAEQKRGVWHFHFLLPYATEIDRVWSKTVERFMAQAWRQDKARWPDPDERRRLIWLEYSGTVTRGFYGFGFVDGGKPYGGPKGDAAAYMARNAAGYMAQNLAGAGRHYVSSRLTRQTGVTMRALRSVNWLYVRRKLIASGELRDSWVPGYWSDTKRDEVLRVWSMLHPAVQDP